VGGSTEITHPAGPIVEVPRCPKKLKAEMDRTRDMATSD